MKHLEGVLSVLLLTAIATTLPLLAVEKKFQPCYQKNSQSIYTVSGTDCIAISEHELICHDPLKKITQLPSGYSMENFDRFARLYKISTPQKLIPVKLKDLSSLDSVKELALIDKSGYSLGSIESYPNGLDSFGRFSLSDTYAKVIGAKCYSAVGIGTGNNEYISSEYIKNFLLKKDSIYSDIGIRLIERKGRFFVHKRDVFSPFNPFMEGDEIISIDSTAAKRIDTLSNKILFSKQGAILNVKIRRDGKTELFKVRTGVRYGGGYLADTFLERFGIYFDKELRIAEVEDGSYAKKSGLKEGDKLILFDGKKVFDFDTLGRLVSKKENRESSILFERDDFQFFFTIQ